MSQEKMREEFENELLVMLRTNHPEMGVGLNEIVNHRSGNEYESSMFSMAWWAWQASRSAMVVELPEAEAAPRNSSSYREGLADGVERGLDQARKAIEAAGLKVKQ